MRYIFLLVLLFTVSACGSKKSAEAEKKSDTVDAAQALAAVSGEEKIGNSEADQFIVEYDKLIIELSDLIEKNKDKLADLDKTEAYKSFEKRANELSARGEALSNKLTDVEKQRFGMIYANKAMKYQALIQKMISNVMQGQKKH
jgi:hypothetical protein